MAKYLLSFKSGTQLNVTADELEVTKNVMGNILGMSWSNMVPKPVYFDIDDLDCIFKLDD